MATGTRRGALRRYIGTEIPASWELGSQLAREHIDYTAPQWCEAFGLDRRAGCTTKQVVCYILTTNVEQGGRGFSLREAGDLIGVAHETVREHCDKAARYLAAHPPDPTIGHKLLAKTRVQRPAPRPLRADDDADMDFVVDRVHGWPAERWKLPPEAYWELNRGGAIPWGYLTVSPLSVGQGVYYARLRIPPSFDGLVRADDDMVPASACDHPALLEWKRRYWRKRYPPRRRPSEAPCLTPLPGSLTGVPTQPDLTHPPGDESTILRLWRRPRQLQPGRI